ncbi:MAG: response regulator transcription factor [Alphaproteobacteria bacterium]|nr:MAG: response regulator transcription factor [Alphaproteobacteria bacterium]
MATILLADDDPLTMAGIKLLLSQSIHQVICEVNDGTAVLDALPSARPDLLLLDVNMPERSGLEVLRTLRERGDKRPVILLTGRISDRRVYEALQIGLNGLVIKASAPQHLLTCLEAVVQGRRWIDHEVLQRAMELSLTPEDGAAAGSLGSLSQRERAVAGLVLRGMRNREIASELGIGEGTVKVHLHKIFEKMGVSSRTELALAAARDGAED